MMGEPDQSSRVARLADALSLVDRELFVYTLLYGLLIGLISHVVQCSIFRKDAHAPKGT